VLAGRYRRLRTLGGGAMGEVWLAQDGLLRRQVAVKQLLAGPDVKDRTRVDRVLREARLAARLGHPHAVAVYDLVLEAGLPFVVMEYVSGPTLAERIRRAGRLGHDEARRLIGQVAAALEAAHNVGIVHRDVKPGNILISAHDTAKLADFGIARGAGDTAFTQTGFMSGTAAYLAPEVARGAAPTPASDIWSLGATLFAAVDGRPPYDDRPQDNLALLTRVVSEPVPAPVFAGTLRPVLQRMLSREPDNRPTAGQVVSMLSAATTATAAQTTVTLATVTRVGNTAVIPPPRTVHARPAAPPAAAAAASVPPVGARVARRKRPAAALGAAVALAATVTVAGLHLSAAAGHSGSTHARSTAPAAPGSPQTIATPTTAAPISAATMTTSGMTNFVRSYYSLVPRDLPTAWTKLGPGLQAQGYPAYADWWSRFDTVTVTPTATDPAGRTVTITLSAHNPSTGTVSSDTEMLTLIPTSDGAGLLIQASTVP
jgi:hypothetical protein